MLIIILSLLIIGNVFAIRKFAQLGRWILMTFALMTEIILVLTLRGVMAA